MNWTKEVSHLLVGRAAFGHSLYSEPIHPVALSIDLPRLARKLDLQKARLSLLHNQCKSMINTVQSHTTHPYVFHQIIPHLRRAIRCISASEDILPGECTLVRLGHVGRRRGLEGDLPYLGLLERTDHDKHHLPVLVRSDGACAVRPSVPHSVNMVEYGCRDGTEQEIALGKSNLSLLDTRGWSGNIRGETGTNVSVRSSWRSVYSHAERTLRQPCSWPKLMPVI